MRHLVVLPLLFGIFIGCSESSPAPTGSDPDATAEPVLVAALGDSITAGSPLWDPDPATRDLISDPDERSQFEFWVSRADPAIEFRNCGVSGERADEIALRLDECADGADALLLQGGINDIAQGRPVEEAAGDLRSMVRAGKALGLPVTLVDVLPWNNGHPTADAPIEELNREIEGIGEELRVPVLPFHNALEDPQETGTMSAGLTIDGDHPSVDGYRELAEQAFGDLALP